MHDARGTPKNDRNTRPFPRWVGGLSENHRLHPHHHIPYPQPQLRHVPHGAPIGTVTIIICCSWRGRHTLSLAMPPAGLMVVHVLSFLIACVVVRGETGSAAQSLIDGTETPNIRYLDLLLQPHAPATTKPWFGGFGGDVAAERVAVTTVGHPLRRMLLHLRREGVELKEAMSWAERGGRCRHLRTAYRLTLMFCLLTVWYVLSI